MMTSYDCVHHRAASVLLEAQLPIFPFALPLALHHAAKASSPSCPWRSYLEENPE